MSLVGDVVSKAWVVAVGAAVLFAYDVRVAKAHPLCWVGDTNPLDATTSTYCPNDDPAGFCCSANEEEALQTQHDAAAVSGTCADLYKEVWDAERDMPVVQNMKSGFLGVSLSVNDKHQDGRFGCLPCLHCSMEFRCVLAWAVSVVVCRF